MSLLKRLVRHGRVQHLLAAIIATYLRLTYRTISWRIEGGEHLDHLRAEGHPVLAAFWHGRMSMIRFLWREDAPFSVLISSHRDGRLIARAIALLEVRAIVGSSRRGGAAALLAIIRTLREGGGVAITPDGPRGPRMRAKSGIAAAARGAGVPVLPVSFGVRRRLVLNSWDRLIMPLPFTRGVFIIGEPIAPESGDEEAVRATVESRLNAITAEADRLAGARPVEPAPSPAPQHRLSA